MKGKNLLKLGLLAGVGLVLAEASKTPATETDSNTNALGFTGNESEAELEAILLRTLKGNKEIQRLLKGEYGTTGAGYKATSNSSVAIATGSKSFDLGTANLAYSAGARVRITAATDGAKWMEGVVTAYSVNTLTVLVDLVNGTGTLASWNINLAGERGLQGAAGDTVVHYCGSLLRNGALELSTLDNWTGGAIGSGTFEGMNILENTGTATLNTNLFYVRPDRLYKLEVNVRGTGTVSFSLASYAKDSVTQLLKANSSSTTYLLQAITPASSSTFEKKVGYCGGLGILGTNFPDNVVKAKFGISTPATFGVAKIVVKEVNLSEPVPYNLPFLPTGQMVRDPTTLEIGYYNGSTIEWFAA